MIKTIHLQSLGRQKLLSIHIWTLKTTVFIHACLGICLFDHLTQATRKVYVVILKCLKSIRSDGSFSLPYILTKIRNSYQTKNFFLSSNKEYMISLSLGLSFLIFLSFPKNIHFFFSPLSPKNNYEIDKYALICSFRFNVTISYFFSFVFRFSLVFDHAK